MLFSSFIRLRLCLSCCSKNEYLIEEAWFYWILEITSFYNYVTEWEIRKSAAFGYSLLIFLNFRLKKNKSY